jgi:hypothetical protein
LWREAYEKSVSLTFDITGLQQSKRGPSAKKEESLRITQELWKRRPLAGLRGSPEGEEVSRMRKLAMVFVAAFVVFGVAGHATAASSDNITVNYEVQAINELNVDDASVTLTISTATAGQQPDSATASTTYDITTNETTKKLTAALDTDMPAGLTLRANVTAPTGGTGSGWTALSSTAADVVTAISKVAEPNLAWNFSLNATVSAGVVAAASKTCTLTLTDGGVVAAASKTCTLTLTDG